MTEQMTRNDVKRIAAYGEVYYTDMNLPTLKYFDKIGYNAGVYGWNYDVYEYGRNVLLVGYRVPSFATYIEPKEVEKVAMNTLKEKINSMEITKQALIKELQALKKNKKF